jgi:hypothetical protein
MFAVVCRTVSAQCSTCRAMQSRRSCTAIFHFTCFSWGNPTMCGEASPYHEAGTIGTYWLNVCLVQRHSRTPTRRGWAVCLRQSNFADLNFVKGSKLGPCPSKAAMCGLDSASVGSLQCNKDCSGQGRCFRGSCKCFTGYVGDFCEQPICWTDAQCKAYDPGSVRHPFSTLGICQAHGHAACYCAHMHGCSPHLY